MDLINYLTDNAINKLIRRFTMIIRKTFQGAWVVSDIVDNQLVSRQYMGYTKREAIQAFKREVLKNG